MAGETAGIRITAAGAAGERAEAPPVGDFTPQNRGMMAIFTERVERWRRQAEEYRTLAGCAKAEGARKAYMSLAADCDSLAERFAETMEAAERDGTATP